ncbi:azurin [Neisseriaceae bacterium B1]
MKIYLGLITAAALTLAACGGESKTAETAPAQQPAASAPVAASVAPAAAESSAPAASEAASAVAPAAAASAECTTVITSDDAMKFDIKEIGIKSGCAQYTITLKHAGKMPAAAMGHNIVITKTADKDGVLADGATAGIATDYVKEGDERVVAHTKLIGGGEETSVTFDTAKLAKDGAYEFFCSFPGHYAMMNGKIKIAD